MTVKEAHNIFKSKYPKLVIVSCHEYDSRFVFEAVLPKHTNIEEGNAVLDCLYAVNKKTKQLSAFKPFDIPIEEYKRGKKVTL